jgi:undecaprenyl-diphosphatase
MSELNLWLFHAVNLTDPSPALLLALARFSSLQLPAMLLVLAVGCLVLSPPSWRKLGLELLVAMAVAWLGARLLQHAWPAPRPFVLGLGHLWITHKASPSFPSTHASVACAFGVLAAWRAPHPVLRWLAPVLAGLVAWSRIAVGVHFPVDVAAGLCVGTVAALLVHLLRPRAAQTPAPATT